MIKTHWREYASREVAQIRKERRKPTPISCCSRVFLAVAKVMLSRTSLLATQAGHPFLPLVAAKPSAGPIEDWGMKTITALTRSNGCATVAHPAFRIAAPSLESQPGNPGNPGKPVA
jgi:hypothetical protein